MWLELCDLITKNVITVSEKSSSFSKETNDNNINVSTVLRTAIKKFTDEVGKLWASLADYYIRRGLFEKARDIYEEGLESVMTVRDFSLIFDAYAAFEEHVLSSKMENDEDVLQNVNVGHKGAVAKFGKELDKIDRKLEVVREKKKSFEKMLTDAKEEASELERKENVIIKAIKNALKVR